MPSISPDGAYLTFLYGADIWQVPTSGGTAERLPVHYASPHPPIFSPDGNLLAFTSYRTGSGDVYVFPMSGGELQQLTYHSSFCRVDDWSANGEALYYTANREHTGEEIYRVPLAGGTPTLIFAEPYQNIRHVSASPDGTMLAFNTPNNPWWRLGPDHFAPCYLWLIPTIPHPERGLASIDNPTNNQKQQENQHGNDDIVFPFVNGIYSPTPNPFALGRWPLWAPDSKGLYFVSDQDGVENIWYQPLGSNEARQVTHFREGRVLWPSIARREGVLVFEREWQIWRLDLANGSAEPVPIRVRADTRITPVRVETWTRGFSEMQVSPDGKKVAFVARGQVFADFADKETDKEMRQGPAFRVTNLPARQGEITWTTDSNNLLYTSDRDGEDEIYRYDFTTRTESRLTNDPIPKSSLCRSPDGTWLAYIRGLDTICLLNLKTGETRTFAQGNFLVSDHTLAWSPDSRWLAYLSHDSRFFSNVYVQRIDKETAHQITFLSNVMGHNLMWSPNGRFLIFTSGQYRTESQIVRVDLYPLPPFFREVEFEKLFEIEAKPGTGEPAPGNDPAHTTSSPEETASPEQEEQPDNDTDQQETSNEHAAGQEEDEKAIAKQEDDTTQENQNKEPPQPDTEKKDANLVEIVFKGIEHRLSFLTPTQMDAQGESISHDSRDLLLLANVAGKVNIWALPLDEPREGSPPQQLTASSASKSNVQFSHNGKSFFYLEDGQITMRKFPPGRDSVTLHTRGEMMVDFEQEKHQIFGEAWRLLRDTFYDPTFRGQDWDAIRKRFAPLAAGARTNGELATILNLMVGELRASHLGAFWRFGSNPSDGYLGVLFDPYTIAQQGLLRVAELVPDSPAALLSDPPRRGEYVVAVNNTPITPEISLDYLLQRTAGRRVLLRLAPSLDSESTREVAVRPVNGDTYADLRYRTWVTINESYVHRESNGRLGYVHVPEMSYAAYQQFLINLDVETHSKEGIVLDIRYNRGGHIATFILDVLTRRSVVLSGFRDRLSTDAYHYSGNRALDKPTVLVANERSASNAEIFTEIYRRLGLGKVVGKPTAGAVIGTIERTLLNRISFRLPLYSISTLEGENLEGMGRMVDVTVDQAPGDWYHGHDHQLQAAIRVLLENLEPRANMGYNHEEVSYED